MLNINLFPVIKNQIKKIIGKKNDWAIGIYQGNSLVDWEALNNICNPVLTVKDVSDVSAEFIADPFMILANGTWYMFFEVLNKANGLGEIGLATSQDVLNWNYQKIILREDFHLSYPYVFYWLNDYYMIPESSQANAIRLYKAVDFPRQWCFVKNLIEGRDYVDTSIFYFDNKWWLFTSSTASNILRLYYADEIMSYWVEHPQSPVIEDDAKIARPGGRVIVNNGTVFRYAQDDQYLYGTKVRAFEIIVLTTTAYKEKPIAENPILQASGSGWNKTGMHHIDAHKIDENKWIACVDGYQMSLGAWT
ncbi:hypothetical protein [Nostoc sp. MG11]|uniref:glucosamine inositolphosphorylceramide transferase family protein n=1 Tax=Nostoc sp. MG11 TaxID=2721166 RepID=UPI001867444C|nr:hypothetical protein [Nostoc sp. MG11]